MEINVDDLLDFCAYYQLNKHASILTVETIFQDNNKPSPIKQKPEKVVRKKIQVVEPKKTEKVEKVVKPKLQGAARKDKKQVPPIVKTSKKNGNGDLNYFMSHMTGHSHQSSQRNYEENLNSNRNYEPYSKNYGQYSTKNYDTFGRGNQNYQYQTYQSKIQKQNAQYSRVNLTERPPQHKSYLTKSYQATEPKQAIPPYGNYQASNIKKFWENTVYETRKNDKLDFGNLMYSPVRRQNPSPTHSLIFSQLQDRSLSKSKSKLKRKNSERPFYNASQLAPKDRQHQTRARKHQYEQSVLSNSFISTEQMRVTNNKKALDDEGRRQTSTTNYAPKNGKNNAKKEAFENDLDDGMEEIINHLASEQRNAPIAISLISREGKL